MNPEPHRGVKHATWRIRFLKEVRPQEKEEVFWALEKGLVEENRILEAHSRVKRFYRVKSQGRSFFVKLREFGSWKRGLGRAFRPTKEERELNNYELLRCRGVPCPKPFASARLQEGFLPQVSVLVTQFMEDVLPLKEVLLGPKGFLLVEPLMGFLGLLKNASILHRDLQWENILIGSPREGFPLYLVDPLHVKPMRGEADKQHFAVSLAWFLGFMMQGGASQELTALLAENMARLGLCAPWGPEELLLRASKVGTRHEKRRKLPPF